jgi:hypothetical protein
MNENNSFRIAFPKEKTMNTKTVRSTALSVLLAFALTFGSFTSGQARTESDPLMSDKTINLAFFYKPPTNSDAATVVRNFSTVILTGGDESFRNQLTSKGFSSTITQYYGAIGIQDPGNCTSSPRHNQVAYNAGDFCSISQNHPDWFLLDATGQRILASPGSDIYRMDPGNSGWRNFFVTRVLEYQGKNGWSGLFLDNLEASLSDIQKYGSTTAKYPDDASYQSAMLGFLQYLKTNYSHPILANIIARRDEASWFKYMPYLDGAMQERWAVDWSTTVYVSETKWKSDMALAEKTQSQGKYILLVAPGNETDANRQQFAFASYLLISNGKSAFRYSNSKNYAQVWLYSNYQLDLGTPLGPRYQNGSLWQRDFTKGYVIVDPINHTSTISTSPLSSWAPTATPLSPTPSVPTPTVNTIAPTRTPVQPTSTPRQSTATPIILPTQTLALPTATNLQPTATPLQPTVTPMILPTEMSAPVTTTPLPTATGVVQPTTGPASEAIFDDKDSGLVYSPGWENQSTTNAYKGSYKLVTQNGASAIFTFTGQSFSLLYKGGITFSKFDLYVDGQLVGTLDQKLSTTTYQKRWDYPGQLGLGQHTLKLIFKVTSSTIYRGSLDAVIVR